jgi:hypothetical protein
MSYKGAAKDEQYVRISLCLIRGEDDDLIAFVEEQAQRQRGPAIKELMRTGLYQEDLVQAILKEVQTTVHQAVGKALESRVVAATDTAPPAEENAELAAALDSISF